MPLVRVCPCACLSQKYDSMAPKSNRQKQCKRIMEQQPRIINARRRKAASSSEVCDECDLTDDRGARSLTACASVPVANASRTCFPTGQEPPVEVLQTLLAASDRAADARHPRDAKHGHESRTEHLEVATRFSSGLIFRLIRLHTVTKKCVHTVGRGCRLSVYGLYCSPSQYRLVSRLTIACKLESARGARSRGG